MMYQEEGQVKLRRQESKRAIALAMQGRWQEAVAANEAIISNFPNDIDACNRLGRAYMELEEYSRSKEAYGKALELDRYNTIARKNLRRLSYLSQAQPGSKGDARKVEPQHFIRETGKAGVVNLYRLAPREVRAGIVAGDEVSLKVAEPNLVVENNRGEYLGQVDPKHGQRLVKLMAGGNKYTGAITSSTEDAMSVIIREVYQDPSQVGRLSFPAKGPESFRPYVSERIFSYEPEYDAVLLDEFADIEQIKTDSGEEEEEV
ncbi:MAG TPA: hypothetical protein DIT43_00290 [Dehalococcoidia bacterium]|nr:hypothetical protein [Dehalococcoidia bacterium]